MKATMVLVGLAIVWLGQAVLAGGDKKAPLPAELKVLERWVGLSVSEAISKPSIFDKKGSRWQGASRDEMTLGGRFLQAHVKQKSDLGTMEFITLRTYDEKKKAFRSWSFFVNDRASGASELTGKWDEATKTMTEEGEDAERGQITIGKTTFKDDGDLEASVLVKNKDGAVLLDRHAVIRRLKPNGVLIPAPKFRRDRSAELKILERYGGVWDTETVNKMSTWNPKETRSTGTVTNEWVLGDQFLQMKSKDSTGTEGLQMRTYDPVTKSYRMWHFDSRGTAISAVGTWDEDKATMTWKSDLGNGITGADIVRFTDADTHEWNLVVRDNDRKVLLDMGGKFSRRK